MAKALITGFQRVVHRVRPAPVGSRLRVTRYRHFSAGLLGREMPAGPDPGSLRCRVAAGHGCDEVVGAAVGASGGSGDVGFAVAAVVADRGVAECGDDGG